MGWWKNPLGWYQVLSPDPNGRAEYGELHAMSSKEDNGNFVMLN